MTKPRPFSDLGVMMPDGSVPMSDLIDLAIGDACGDVELDPFITCELVEGTWVCDVRLDEHNTLKLTVSQAFAIRFWGNCQPLHFNQAPLYAKLYELGFIQINKTKVSK